MGTSRKDVDLTMKTHSEDMFWQMYANIYDLVRFLPPYQHVLKDVQIAANVSPGEKVLDAGCGTANFILQVAADSGATFTGVDISRIMLKKAREKTNHLKNVTLSWMNLNEKLPYKSETYDKIVAINSIYAARNPEFTVRELIRVLKPGGTIVIVNPHAHAKFTAAYFEILNSGRGLQKLVLFIVTIPLFVFNLIIKLKANSKEFHFLSQDDWKRIGKRDSIKSVRIKETYMQSYLLTIQKKHT